MMEQAQKMMANMKPEDMQRMSDMAANMDPNTMESMMKNMGGNVPSGYDPKQMSEQMKNMTPEQIRQGMTQAQSQMGAQKQYVYNGALHLKNEGNTHIKNEEYTKALEAYDRAIDNLRPHSGADVNTLKVQLMSNAALCHLKQKNYKKALDVTEEALKVDEKAVKPLYRRGLAHENMGDLPKALRDVTDASLLSPDDKAITSELTRLRKICKEQGIEAAARPAPKLERAASSPSSFSPGSSSSSSGKPEMSQALDAMSKNPEMMDQATDMMSKMSDEDIARMMPGTDPKLIRSSLQNKDQLKTAMDSFKNMSEEDRKRLMEQSASMQNGGVPDMSKMGEMFENPDMIKQMAAMAQNQENVDPEQAAMMKNVSEQLEKNPELGKQMSEMMKNMPPEQMQKMMEMSSKMKGGGLQRSKSEGGMPENMDADSLSGFMDDPAMMKAAEDMMKNMSPEMLASMAKSSGVDLDENKAAMLGKMMPYMPYLMRCMRAFSYLRKGWKGLWSKKGRIALAVLVLCIALYQHNFSS
jgi:tetratricopeptide (TPR) repeat protein